MKLLLMIDHVGSGGAQRQIVNLAKGLCKRGHHIDMFVYYPRLSRHRAELEEAGVRVIGVEKLSRWSLRPLQRARRLLRTGRYDGVISYLRTPSVYAVLARLLLRPRPVLIVSERSSAANGRLTAVDRLFMHCFRLADCIVTNSRYQSRIIADAFPGMASRVKVIYNGVEARTAPTTPARPARRDGLHLVAVGSVEPGKNCRGLAQALIVCHQQFGFCPRVTWVGRESDGEAASIRTSVLQLLSNVGLQEYWTWMGEIDDVAMVLHEHDALVHPSLFEGCSNAIAEALASGLPVLASSAGDSEVIVSRSGAGFVFSPHDPAQMAASFVAFSRLGVDARTRMGQRGREAAATLLSLDGMIDRYESVLKALLTNNEQDSAMQRPAAPSGSVRRMQGR